LIAGSTPKGQQRGAARPPTTATNLNEKSKNSQRLDVAWLQPHSGRFVSFFFSSFFGKAVEFEARLSAIFKEQFKTTVDDQP